ncbi:unnamed protein product [Owenia fusiformis]|uniref:Uncharacterized protein n=1 Tax=Owenia fusiformis TaxID=6347 RepID=A0A8J1XWL6_OWEFU|nr:unnamed protein product [Owenia fusiformis]
MTTRAPIKPELYEAIQNVDVIRLSQFTDVEIRPVLPCLVRMSLCATLDTSERWTEERKRILQILSGQEVVNSLVDLLSVDFHVLDIDVKKEQQLRTKIGGQQTDSVLISQLQHGLALEFERSSAARKLRLFLSELLFIMGQMRESTRTEFYHKSSELFESEAYLEEVSDVLCIAQAELPKLLPLSEVAEALLHVSNGSWLLCRLITNVPDSFLEVCTALVKNGEKQDEGLIGGRRRSQMLKMLCEMCPGQAMTIRSLCVENCRLPGLAVSLSLQLQNSTSGDRMETDDITDNPSTDLLAFVNSMLLGNNSDARAWFSLYVRNGQKHKTNPKSSTLYKLREQLLEELIMVLPESGSILQEEQVTMASSFIRLYCALKGIASLKASDEEVKLLLRLVTCHPPPTNTGAQFVCLGLCMLLACPFLLATPDQERVAIDWIKWLVKEEAYFENTKGSSGSYGEMLLLIAIHFHSNQTSAIVELVSQTLGMKSAVKTNTLSRMKTIFTQEIFNEQVVTTHAVRVPVTANLNANMTGYLPIHCIYQLLKSRAFSKHKVQIKDWIFKQLCSSTTPIHPLLPPLINVYVNSIISPSNKSDHTNSPITQKEIMTVFQDSVLVKHSKLTGDHFRKSRSFSVDEWPQVGEYGSQFTTQILLLFYLLQYEDTRINNMKTIVSQKRQVHQYSPSLLSQIPMKYLLQKAQRDQQQYAGLFSPILRLLASHYPQLCMVEDWLEEEYTEMLTLQLSSCNVTSHNTSPDLLHHAFTEIDTNDAALVLQLNCLMQLSAEDIIPYADALTMNLPRLLTPTVPRAILDQVKHVWLKLNTVMPRRLRVMTVNALRSKEDASDQVMLSQDDLTQNPLLILRCQDAVYRSAPVLEVALRVLSAFLQASRAQLNQHIQANPVLDHTQQQAVSLEREELKGALQSAQESAVVQILLEVCLPTTLEKDSNTLLTDLREVQCVIFSHIHQMFIAEPNLAKLVHFQGYDVSLLPLTVAAIPSMHICLDFIPELLSQPHLEKQVFAVVLVSYLSLQYPLPKALDVAKLAVSVLTTQLGVLKADQRAEFFLPTLQPIVRIAKAFPPLVDDIVAFLQQLGRACESHIAVMEGHILKDNTTNPSANRETEPEISSQMTEEQKLNNKLPIYLELSQQIQRTFSDVVKTAALVPVDC